MDNTQANPRRILLINRDSFELATLSASLRLHGVNIVGEASHNFLAENLFTSLQPEIILIDLQPPGEEPIKFLNKARKLNPHCGIVVITACPDFRLMGLQEKNIPRGSQILKRSLSDLSVFAETFDRSLDAVNAESRLTWISANASIHETSLINTARELSDVQMETLRLLAQGLSNSEIARVRFVSEKSVEQIVARIAQHLSISPDRSRNMRVILAAEYFKWLGAPRH